MAATLNPALSTTLKTQRIFVGPTGTNVAETWLVPSGSVTTFESAWPIGTAHGTVTTAYLAGRSKEPIDGDGGATVAFKYDLQFAPQSFRVSWLSPGEETVETSANAQDLPIDIHPTLTDPQKLALRNTGVDSYLSPQPTFIHSEYKDRSTYTLTESEAVQGVGRIASSGTLSAAGLYSASSGKWLMVDRRIRFNGDVVEVVRVWQYAENGWDTDIYANE